MKKSVLNKKIKIVFFLRLFDGLKYGFEKKKWKPSGVPTITNLIENLDKSGWNIELYFTDFSSNKDSGSVNENEYNVKISGLKNRINIIKTNLLYTSKFHKIFNLIKRIKNTIYYVLLCIKLKPDLIYIDRAHAFEGALISRFLKKKVFLRMMGVAVYNQEKIENLKKNKIKFSFFRWIFSSPFSYVLFTNDGSDYENWAKLFLRKNVKFNSLINGVNKNNKLSKYNLKKKFKNKILILFVGRLVGYKRCEVFIESILNLNINLKKKIKAIIIGDGEKKKDLIDKVNKSQFNSCFEFYGSLPYNLVQNFYHQCHIFVSLNWLGNLSNTCLEAYANGICCIIPESNNDIDKTTDKLIPTNAVRRIKLENLTVNLTKEIEYLIKNPNEIKRNKFEIKKRSDSLIPTWNKRIMKEKEIFLNLINEKKK